MFRTIAAVALAGFVLASLSVAEVNVPRGYYLVNLTENDGFNRWCSINNHGQIVWSTGFNPFDAGTYEIMMYDRGEIRQITSNNVYDDYPNINDAGQIVWSSETGPGGVKEIWLYENGTARRIQDESLQTSPQDNWTPEINESGNIVWNRRSPEPQCNPADSEVWMYEGTKSFQLSYVGGSNQLAHINNADEIVWTHLDLCVEPVASQIMLSSNNAIEVISPQEHGQPGNAVISDVGRIFWSDRVDTAYELAVTLWQDGLVSEFNPWGLVGRVSDNGILSINRWFESNRTWQIVLAHDGQFTQLTDDEFWNAEGAVNSLGEIAWTYGTSPYYQNRALLRYLMGDLNCDHQVGLGDISSFVQAVTRPADYEEAHSLCDAALADVNEDGVVSVGDIAGFVSLVLTQQAGS